eukprot:1644011-Prymnesium_polylepis.1
MLVPARRGLVHLGLVCSWRFASTRRRSATYLRKKESPGWTSFNHCRAHRLCLRHAALAHSRGAARWDKSGSARYAV